MNRIFPSVIVLAIVLVTLWVLIANIFFTVDERELAVVLQFGEPIAGFTEPGLKWKLPFIHEVRRFPKTYQFWLGTGGEILVDVPTADGKKIEVTPWAIWRITDPVQFVRELRTVANGELRIKEFVRSQLRDAITANNLVEVVRSSDRKLSYTLQVGMLGGESSQVPNEQMVVAQELTRTTAGTAVASEVERVRLGREKLVAQVKAAVRERLHRGSKGEEIRRGIELVDMGIARVDFVPTVQEAAFKRLIAFLESVAAYYVNEGQRRKQEILNMTHYEVEKILGEGKREANRIRGQVEAEIIQMYADAIRQMGEFYDFIRTLEMYKKCFGPNTRLVVTTESEIFALFRRLSPVPGEPEAVAGATSSSTPAVPVVEETRE